MSLELKFYESEGCENILQLIVKIVSLVPIRRLQKNGMAPHILWHSSSISLLLAASVALVFALSRAHDWGVLKGSKLCSWDATSSTSIL
jgi:hypothetical protein